MTHRFELGDNLNADKGSNDTHLALLDDAMTIHRIGDKGQKAGDAVDQATKEAAEEPTSAAQKQFIEAAEAFDAADDKRKAIKELGPKFEGAIKTADDDFDKTMKSASAESVKLKPAYEKAMGAVQENNMKAALAFAQVPEEEQAKVKALVEAYTHLDKDDPIHKAIQQGLAKYPGLTDAVDGMKTAMEDPAIKRVAELQAQMEAAMSDRVMTRFGYAQALKESGDEIKAFQIMKDAAGILGIEIPQKLPPGMLEANQLKAYRHLSGGDRNA